VSSTVSSTGQAARIADDVQAQALLAPLGLRWPRSVIVDDPAGLPAALAELGWPGAQGEQGARLVAKTAARLSHRANSGGVVLGLRDEGEVRASVAFLAARFGAPVLLAEHVPFEQAYFVGLQRGDASHTYIAFGAGVATDESQVALRLCPLGAGDAQSLLEYARHRSGTQPPAGLRDVLVGLSQIAASRPDLEVIDINPLVTDPEGRLTVLDVKAYLRDPDDTQGTGTQRTEARHGSAAEHRG
jgi:succinyl-CoA synthetase beta subunit